MFHLICIVHDTDVDLTHYAQHLGFASRIKASFCVQFALNCFPRVKCCQYTSPFPSAHRRQFQQDQLTTTSHTPLSLSFSPAAMRSAPSPRAAIFLLAAFSLLVPQSRATGTSTLLTLCALHQTLTQSLSTGPLHCTAAITVLSCVALCALQQTLTQCLSTTALYCSYYCIELCCTLCSTADSNTVSLPLHCTSYYCIELCCSLPLQTLPLVWSRVATQWEKMTVFCRYVCMELSVKELQSLI